MYPKNNGNPCEGKLKEIKSCNVGPRFCAAPVAEAPKPIDCKLGAFTKWTECSATCGGGIKTRSRELETPPQHGGTPCDGELREVMGCGLDGCPVKKVKVEHVGGWGSREALFMCVRLLPRAGGIPCCGALCARDVNIPAVLPRPGSQNRHSPGPPLKRPPTRGLRDG